MPLILIGEGVETAMNGSQKTCQSKKHRGSLRKGDGVLQGLSTLFVDHCIAVIV